MVVFSQTATGAVAATCRLLLATHSVAVSAQRATANSRVDSEGGVCSVREKLKDAAERLEMLKLKPWATSVSHDREPTTIDPIKLSSQKETNDGGASSFIRYTDTAIPFNRPHSVGAELSGHPDPPRGREGRVKDRNQSETMYHRVERLKAARAEALKEIESLKAEKNKEFVAFEATFSGSNDDSFAKVNAETDKKIVEITEAYQKNKELVIERMLAAVVAVEPKVCLPFRK
ncbi:H(+)-transporting V1 sector ATPase subunit G [Entophlyctis luteolus]|nr:H(+)-transporting V1 sector ATPase subunit G [Entophlyctis luteolus]